MKKWTIILIVFFGVIVLGVWKTLGPRRHAEESRQKVQVGMSLAEVMAAVSPSFCDGHPMAGPREESVRIFPNSEVELTVYGPNRQVTTRHVPLQDLTQEMKASDVDWVFDFGFVAMPRRVYFLVTFGPDGRVKTVSNLQSAD